MRQYVVVKFKAGDSRTYTYHNDAESVAVGDVVKIAERDGNGWSRATVCEVSANVPKFETKQIVGKLNKGD